jgi:hypothetical protein
MWPYSDLPNRPQKAETTVSQWEVMKAKDLNNETYGLHFLASLYKQEEF